LRDFVRVVNGTISVEWTVRRDTILHDPIGPPKTVISTLNRQKDYTPTSVNNCNLHDVGTNPALLFTNNNNVTLVKRYMTLITNNRLGVAGRVTEAKTTSPSSFYHLVVPNPVSSQQHRNLFPSRTHRTASWRRCRGVLLRLRRLLRAPRGPCWKAITAEP
jgi:hypothetical protein